MRCRRAFRAADRFATSIAMHRFIAGLLAAACCLLPAMAKADVADFYKGKTIEVLVGFSAGGGYDLYARALAKSIGNYIPGKPSVVVRNFTGAGSLRLARFLQDAAPRDGLTIGTMDNGLLTAGLMNPSAGFDASKLEWVGAIAKDVQVIFLWNKQPGKPAKSLGSEKLSFGATGTDDIRYTSTNVLKKLTSANINIVTGYPGTSDIRIAVERGELDGLSESWTSVKSTKPEWVERHQVTPIVQFAFAPHPELKDVPLVSTYARSPDELEALKIIFSSGEAGRPFAAPPGVPRDRLEALRQAFTKTMSDPEFVAYTNQAKLEVAPSTGEEVAAFVDRISKSPPAVVETARKLLEP